MFLGIPLPQWVNLNGTTVKNGLEKSINYKKPITLFRLDITFNLPKRKTQSRKEQLRFAVLLTDSCLLSFFLITLQHVIPLLIQYIYPAQSVSHLLFKKNTHTHCVLFPNKQMSLSVKLSQHPDVVQFIQPANQQSPQSQSAIKRIYITALVKYIIYKCLCVCVCVKLLWSCRIHPDDQQIWMQNYTTRIDLYTKSHARRRRPGKTHTT